MNGPMKSAAVYGGLLAVLLGASWVRWTAEPALELDGKVIMVAGAPDDILSVTWFAENKDKAVISRKSDAHGDYYWVDYTRWTEVKAPAPAAPAEDAAGEDAAGADAGADGDAGAEEAAAAEAAPAPEYEESHQVFKAADKAEELFADLAPLLALRKLTDIDDEKRKATGLDSATESIEIQKAGKTITIRLGGEVYGTRDRYARIDGAPDIYLVDDELLRPLKYARTRLPDRSLWPFEVKALTKLTLAAGEDSAAFLQKNAADPAKAAWLREGAEADETQAQTWIEKALKLKSVSYADAEDDTDSLELVFALTLESEEGQTETVEVLKSPDAAEYWARSGHTRGVVKLLRGPTSQLVEDVGTVVAGG